MKETLGRRAGSRTAGRYAIELVVVFAGVWLSLLAENWRQGQSDRSTAVASMARMTEDLGSDLEDFQSNRERAELGVSWGIWLLGRGTSSEATPDSVGRALTALQFCSILLENTAEYESLRNSGRLGIISDPELRRSIVGQYESRRFMRVLHEVDCEAETDVFGLMAGHVVTQESPSAGGASVYGFPDGLRPRIIAVPGRLDLMADPEFRSHVTRLISAKGFLIRQIDQQIQSTDALREELGARIR
jgi:hypothetical protein